MKPIRLETTSVDGTKINLEALYQIAPSCFTEEKDEETGEIKRVVNFETLRQLLGGDAVDEDEEMYQFMWPGKRAARYEAAEPIDDTLRPVPADAVDWDTTENLYIEGDNLRVLKLLQRGYMGKVKMIYIDPPYNTGNDFVYHDDFAHSAEEEDLAAGNIDEEGYRYRRNLDSNGRFHSDWCSMMYSRLLVAHSLLKEDGVIFISIDDNEVHNLRKICDEVFGAGNFVGEVIWQSATDNNPRQISTEHEYLLCFAKQTQNLPNWLIGSENAKKIELQYEIIKDKFHDIKSQQEELRKWIKVNKAELKGVTHYNNIDEKGVYSNSSNSSNTKPGGYMFDIIHPITHKPCVKPAFGWRWTENTFWNYNANGDIEWGTDETTQPHVKKRISSVKEQLKSIYYEDGRVSTKGLEQLFEAKKIFDNPKPLKLIKRLINFTTQEDSLILDFFSGSATTAHAVMQLNAEDGGKRKYICVQLPEETPEGSEARKAGYATIPEIAKERIRRAGKKIKEESPLTTQDLDTGFRVFRIDSGNYKDVTMQPNEYNQQMLDLFVDNIKADRTDLDLLFGAMLAWGVQLSLPMTTEEVDGCKIYAVDGNGLVACFAENISENVVQAMAAKQPLRVLFRDSCFDEDKTKINIFERFKQQLDWDEKEAIQNIRVV
ncbi:site-specific DNA-methyltransferase [Prevotella jejuni]|uniref:site-specific DNA-methyltransferase n=1 Tax=Prevotella jejuni TaxID=1177574 RepID=UPI001C5EC0EF|nr:site-specific DNA-methyltransferase [Prevotella jejuni]MBW4772783.1 site-specific DNA-methyltransferase [Prevotella jejuni]